MPQDHPTIQEGVDHAAPGGMVLIDAGIYRESVRVTVPYLTIRGMDRNRTIVDGGFERTNGFEVIDTDGVAIENITARNNLLNGFLWSGACGYRGSYLTASNNGDHGISAFASRYGQFDHSYASGSPDSGFSIGGCAPCNALITDVEAEHNLIGYSGTNAGGNLAIVNSEWHDNAAGIVPNTLDSEPEAPQHDALIAGNHVHDNDDEDAPMTSDEWAPALGNGIIVAGGVGNSVVGNLVEDQAAVRGRADPDARRTVLADGRQPHRGQRRAGGAGSPTSPSRVRRPAATASRTTTRARACRAAIEALFPCSGFRPNPAGGGAMAPWTVLGPRLLADVPLPDYRGPARRRPTRPRCRATRLGAALTRRRRSRPCRGPTPSAP